MASQKQTEANRLNSQNSTGPRSPEGKSASRMNALKSGIDAKSQVIRGEKAANLETLKTEYHDRFHPTTPEQRMLVDTLIDADWLLRRFRIVEAQLWEEGSLSAFKPNDEITLGQSYCENSNQFTRLQRRIDTAQRNYRNALQDLQRLQAEAPDPAPQPDPPARRNQPVIPANGFVPQTTPANPVEAPPSPSPSEKGELQTCEHSLQSRAQRAPR
jgi:hypothetical protein